MTISIDIPGSKVIDIDGEPALAFGNYTFHQDDILKISKCDTVVGLLFYQAQFNNADLSVLNKLPLKKITVLHGNFGDAELSQLEAFEALKSLKLFDTKVSSQALTSFQSNHPNVELK